jgi:redox-sensing transcriptional repressor
MTSRSRIPRPTAKRLSLYLRELEARAGDDEQTISSRQLGGALGLSDAQVRKDLALFGQFGHPGVGYNVGELTERLRQILRSDRTWKAAVIGAGKLGRALIGYERFARKGFEFVAIFDKDPAVVGQAIAGLTVRSMSDLPRLARELGIELGIVTVPPEAAQEVTEALIQAGVLGILNFAPVRLDVHDQVVVRSVDFSVALEQLAFQVSAGLSRSQLEE